jgi:3-isopropylmalate dehydrogenase
MNAKITILSGDGIGPEVTREAVRALRPLIDFAGHDFEIREHAIGGEAVRKFGDPLPPATLEACLESDAVFLGAVGGPDFDALPPSLRPEAGLLRLRQALGGFANLRPVRTFAALAGTSPLRAELVRSTDILIVRELLGGVYFGEPRGLERNGSRRAFNTMSYSEDQIARVAEVAFQHARERRRKVTSVDKANVLETSRLWREVVNDIGRRYPDVKLEHMYVDACAMALTLKPQHFDVILTENLFGDILSDQAAGISGSLGLLPSATVGGTVDLYEPIHGSAPDIAGTNRANPIGAILSMAMLLRRSLGLPREAAEMESAVESVLNAGYRSADLSPAGSHCVGTSAMGELVEKAFADQLDRQYAYHAV